MGRAQAKDDYDSICRLLSQSYECATIEIDGCVPWEEPYNDVNVNYNWRQCFYSMHFCKPKQKMCRCRLHCRNLLHYKSDKTFNRPSPSRSQFTTQKRIRKK